jgi:glutamine synthetase
MVLAAGLDGIKRQLDAGEPINRDTYQLTDEELAAYGDLRLPATLDEALDDFESDEVAREVFGPAFHATYLAYKRQEAHEYRSVVTDWETRTYLQRI